MAYFDQNCFPLMCKMKNIQVQNRNYVEQTIVISIILELPLLFRKTSS